MAAGVISLRIEFTLEVIFQDFVFRKRLTDSHSSSRQYDKHNALNTTELEVRESKEIIWFKNHQWVRKLKMVEGDMAGSVWERHM